MKKIVFALMLMMVVSFSVSAHNPMHRPVSISMQYFYDELTPYGDWVYSGEYGYVWRPYFDSPEYFRPYSSGGRWIYTGYGWTWASDYDWGWATFHYGRWYYDDYLGWMWIPGYEWAPAWVTWGSYNNYWGWAPLGPNIYVGVNTGWYAPDIWWTFVPRRHFCSNSWNNHIYYNRVNVTNITIINNVYVDNSNHYYGNSWYEGPRVNDVERYGRTRVKRHEVVNVQHPSDIRGSSQGRVNVFRPEIDRSEDRRHRPADITSTTDVRTGARIRQSSARENNPGMSRTREERPATGRTSVDNNRRSTRSIEPGSTTRPVNVNTERRGSSTGIERNDRPDVNRRETGTTGVKRTEQGNSTGMGRYDKPENNSVRVRETERNDRPDVNRREIGSTGVKRTEQGSSTGMGRYQKPEDNNVRIRETERNDRPDVNRRETGNTGVKRTETGNSSSATPSRNSVRESNVKRNDSGTGRNESRPTENRSVRSSESNSKPASVQTTKQGSSTRISSTETRKSAPSSNQADQSKKTTRPGR